MVEATEDDRRDHAPAFATRPELQGAAADDASTVRLVTFPPLWGRNVSPFALKLETWLRLAGVPFVLRTSLNLGKAPKGKLPFIVDDGVEIGDSTLIIEHLKASRGIDPDAGLDALACARATALQRLVEDHLYFIMVHARWLDPEGAAVLRPAVNELLPWPLRPFAWPLAQRRVRALLQAQGLGRHDARAILDFARADLDGLSAMLDGRPFFAGDTLTTIDATVFGFLANILFVPIEGPLQRLLLTYPDLVAWCETMEAGLYGEA